MTVQNLYPEQLREIAEFISVLNKFTTTVEKTIQVGQIPIFDDGGQTLLGHVMDEIGGAWSFRAATSLEG